MTNTDPYHDRTVLRPHIDYVSRVRPDMLGDQCVVEFSRPLMAIDERDVLEIAAMLLGVSLDRVLSA